MLKDSQAKSLGIARAKVVGNFTWIGKEKNLLCSFKSCHHSKQGLNRIVRPGSLPVRLPSQLASVPVTVYCLQAWPWLQGLSLTLRRPSSGCSAGLLRQHWLTSITCPQNFSPVPFQAGFNHPNIFQNLLLESWSSHVQFVQDFQVIKFK